MSIVAIAGCGGEVEDERTEPGEGPIARSVEDSGLEPAPEGKEAGVSGVERGDLARFVGEYGTAESAERGRTFWVVEHCDGYLAAGAMWGDASPWILEPVSETAFAEGGTADRPRVRLEFGMGAGGEVENLRVLYDGRPMLEDYPQLERLRRVPPGFDGECWSRDRE